jgi:hypothetical protein
MNTFLKFFLFALLQLFIITHCSDMDMVDDMQRLLNIQNREPQYTPNGEPHYTTNGGARTPQGGARTPNGGVHTPQGSHGHPNSSNEEDGIPEEEEKNDTEKESEGMAGWLIAVIVILVLLGVGIPIGICVCCCCCAVKAGESMFGGRNKQPTTVIYQQPPVSVKPVTHAQAPKTSMV